MDSPDGAASRRIVSVSAYVIFPCTEAEALTTHLNAAPSEYQCTHLHHPPIFTPDALPTTTLPIYPGLNNAGLHNAYPAA